MKVNRKRHRTQLYQYQLKKKKDRKSNVKLVIINSQNVHWTQLSLIGTLRQQIYHGILPIY